MKKTIENFIKSGYKGDGKYYLHTQGSRVYNSSEFTKFKNQNPQYIKKVSEVLNDAPKGGKIGDYVNVTFTKEFKELVLKYQERRALIEAKINRHAKDEQKAILKYASMITFKEGELHEETQKRLSEALGGERIKANIFFKAIKLIRANGKVTK